MVFTRDESEGDVWDEPLLANGLECRCLAMESAPIPLSYAGARIRRPSRFAAWLGRWPAWLLGFVLIVPVVAMDVLGVPQRLSRRYDDLLEQVLLVMPFLVFAMVGAIQRLRWRHLLLMFGVGMFCWAVDWLLMKWPTGLPIPYSTFLWPAVCVGMVGLCEWALTTDRNTATLGWVFPVSIAAGCLITLLRWLLSYMELEISIPRGGTRELLTSWGTILGWPIIFCTAWSLLPLALRAPYARRFRLHLLATVAVAVLVFLLFFHVLRYSLAARSLAARKPFGRVSSVWILMSRGQAQDRQAVMCGLQGADWSVGLDKLRWDYRSLSIVLLTKDDPAGTAMQLSQLLRGQPSLILARSSAELLGKQRRYEAAPELMRIALLGEPSCTDALEQMDAPEAALPMLRHSFGFWRGQLDQDERRKLTRLLGRDAGPIAGDWSELYDEVIDQRPSPLPAEVRSEVKRVIAAIYQYVEQKEQLEEAVRLLTNRRIEKDLAGRSFLTAEQLLERDLVSPQTLLRYEDQARRDLAVQPPDWNIPGTAGLEREIDEFTKRAKRTLTQHGVVPTPAK